MHARASASPLALLLFVGAAGLAEAPAFAAPPAPPASPAPATPATPPPPLAQSLKGAAKAAYDGGRLLFDTQDFAGAETKFRAAYRESSDARLLWNIATCERGLRHYARTAILIEQFLDAASGLVPREFVAQARTTLATLRELYSPLLVTVLPAGARVSIDGEPVGTAPFPKAVPLDLGTHTVRAELDGFAPQEQSIEAAGHDPVAFTVTLKELPTTAELVIAPSDTADIVSIDGKVVGSGRWRGDVPAGVHKVKVSAPGKRSYVGELEIAVGEHRSVDVTLEAERGPVLWPWIVGGAAVVAGAFIGAGFALKPGTTYTGPPAGPSAGTVQLSSFKGLVLR